MRYVLGFLCVCALGVMPLVGCSETTGDGGNGGSAGEGGSGGMAGTGGVGGDCNEDVAQCMLGDVVGGCLNGSCRVFDCPGWEDGTLCISTSLGDEWHPGACAAGSCLSECEVLEEGDACALRVPNDMPTSYETGVCANGACEARCEIDEDCSDYNDCTAGEMCLSNGLCQEGGAVQDGTPCAGGTCQSGACVLESLVLPCTEQGVRNAVAAGGGPYTFDCEGSQTIVIRAPITIDKDVSLNGEGNLTIHGFESPPPQRPDDGLDLSVFYVNADVTAELHGLAIGDSGFRAIINAGALTLGNSVVSGNPGGGIHNEETGTLTATGLTISNNECSSDCDGAGIYNEGVLTLTASTVSGNSSRGGGGGILNWDANGQGEGAMSIVNTTISGNRASAEGGGISSDSGRTLAMTNCTIVGNTSDEQLGSISNIGSLMLSNTLVDGDCEGTLTSNGYNIESPGDTCGFNQGTDLVNVTEGQLDLEPLADNGGPTMTHALLPGSVAIDHIPAIDCQVTEDQRGLPRPGGAMCDVGSVEVQP